MDPQKKELLEMLKAYQELELRNVKKCEEKEERLKSPGAKLMFSQIRMDSAKHAYVLQGLMDMVREDDHEYLWNHRIDKFVGKLSVEKALEEHIELEHEMVQRCQALIDKTTDPNLKAVLTFLIEDENAHEQLLEDVIRQFSKFPGH